MQPTSPDPKFDFMLKNNQPAKKARVLPGIPKPAKIILAVVAAIFLIIIISSVLSNRSKGSNQALIDVLARNQETLRVTTLAQSQLHLQDPGTQAIAATVAASLGSDSQQLTDYLLKNKIKVSKTELAADADKTTDTELQTAAQNNNLDSAYKTYLKNNLSKYAVELQEAYSSAGPNGKIILKNALDSTQTLLQTNPLKSS